MLEHIQLLPYVGAANTLINLPLNVLLHHALEFLHEGASMLVFKYARNVFFPIPVILLVELLHVTEPPRWHESIDKLLREPFDAELHLHLEEAFVHVNLNFYLFN
jgi:hypothetical protein